MWRVLFDANVFISYLLNPSGTSAINRVVDLCLSGEVQTIVALELLEEVERKAKTKPDLAKRIEPRAVDLFVQTLLDIGELVTVGAAEDRVRLRDTKDSYLLRAAEAGEVDFLVTGDRDLLDERDDIQHLVIVTARELLVLVQGLTLDK